jgi:putative DNA primase/helicase
VSAPPGEIDFRGLMEPVARHFLGEPNAALSTKDILRWGTHGSMAVDRVKDVFFDNEQKTGGGVIEFTMRQQLSQRPEAIAFLKENWPSHFPAPKPNGDARHSVPRGQIEKVYSYVDEGGVLLFQVVRKKNPKAFLQRRPDPEAEGGWTWSTKGVRQVIYRLPEVLAAIAEGRPILIAEGEKDVDRCWREGLAATCNAGGAGKWRAELHAFFKGADVVVIGDHDPQAKNRDGALLWHKDGRPQLPGQDHATWVASRLLKVAGRVRLLRDLGEVWPDCPAKGDVSDWFDAGKTAADLTAIVDALPNHVAEVPRKSARDEGVSDSGLAGAFAAQDDDGRYDGDWWVWDGRRWRGNGELAVLGAIRAWLEREIIPTLAKRPQVQEHLGSNRKLVAIERELRLLRHVQPDAWDADPWVLNTPAGTWELRGTPRLREHRREDYLTKVTACSAGGDCPRWKQHIEFVTRGDPDYASYLQKLSGYGLMGERADQVFAFIYGGGGNGKGVYLQTTTSVMGDYAVWSQAETFLESRFPRHSEELMVMRGARLVVASEIPEDAEWNTARLKQLTGGDKVRAHYMRKDSVEFAATALIVLAGNDKPKLKSIDPGVRRRLHLLPFTNAVTAETDIKGLAGQLVAQEGGGILAWLLEGCRRVQAEGLGPPIAVTGATEDYLQEENYVERWLEERCIRREVDIRLEPRTRIGALFEDYQRWAKRTRIDPGNINGFGDKLVRLGHERHRTHGVRYVLGVEIRREGDNGEEDQPHAYN